MAALCVELRMKPADYWDLRADEFDALIDELKTRQKQAKAAQA
jgi:hypothetical protein